MQHFPELQLSIEEGRVLGCLLEKEILTPAGYPMTLNSLVTACNQSSSREPVTDLSGEQVEEALRNLSEKYLVEKVLGGRAPKYEHCLTHVLSMQDSERAILTVLLLRGIQTTGELKQRTERMHPFPSLEEVEETLTWFIDYPHGPLVKRIPVGTGRRVETFAHLLSENPGRSETPESPPAPATPPSPDPKPDPPAPRSDPLWRGRIEARLADLERQITDLRERLGE